MLNLCKCMHVIYQQRWQASYPCCVCACVRVFVCVDNLPVCGSTRTLEGVIHFLRFLFLSTSRFIPLLHFCCSFLCFISAVLSFLLSLHFCCSFLYFLSLLSLCCSFLSTFHPFLLFFPLLQFCHSFLSSFLLFFSFFISIHFCCPFLSSISDVHSSLRFSCVVF